MTSKYNKVKRKLQKSFPYSRKARPVTKVIFTASQLAFKNPSHYQYLNMQ